jgi:hypothetical protein
MQRLVTKNAATPEWIIVQPNRYRYATFLHNGVIVVQMVLSGYLGCEVIWR